MSPSMNSLGNRGDFVCGHIQIKPYQPLVSSLVKTRLKRKPILYSAWSGIYCLFYIYELSWQNLGTASNIINFWRSTKASQIKYVEYIVTLLLGCESIYINCFRTYYRPKQDYGVVLLNLLAVRARFQGKVFKFA